MGLKLLHHNNRGFVSPLVPDHRRKRENATQQNARTATSRVLSALYVGENFAVQIPLSLNVKHIVNDKTSGKFLTSSFFNRRCSMASLSLSAGGYKILATPNAGGSSIVSEVLSFEILGRCFGAKLTKTETEVPYFPHGGAMTDYVCEMAGATVGVSVTRAFKFRGDYSLEDAAHLLNKKLKGVLQSTCNSLVPWNKQILHVWASTDSVTQLLQQAYLDLDRDVKANTVVFVTTAPNTDYIFLNG